MAGYDYRDSERIFETINTTSSTSDIWQQWTTPDNSAVYVSGRAGGCTTNHVTIWNRWVQIPPDYDIDIRTEKGMESDALDISRELLRSMLSKEQLAEFDQHGVVSVVVDEITKLVIAPGMASNVKLFENGQHTENLCLHVDHDVPVYDDMLAQILLAETNPELFLQEANHYSAF